MQQLCHAFLLFLTRSSGDTSQRGELKQNQGKHHHWLYFKSLQLCCIVSAAPVRPTSITVMPASKQRGHGNKPSKPSVFLPVGWERAAGRSVWPCTAPASQPGSAGRTKTPVFPPKSAAVSPTSQPTLCPQKGSGFHFPATFLIPPSSLYIGCCCVFFSSALTYMGTMQGLRVEWKFRLCSHWPKPKILPQIKLPALLAEPASPDRASSPRISSHRAFAAELKAPGCLCFARKQPHRVQVEG